jgi:hypothetical protein
VLTVTTSASNLLQEQGKRPRAHAIAAVSKRSTDACVTCVLVIYIRPVRVNVRRQPVPYASSLGSVIESKVALQENS